MGLRTIVTLDLTHFASGKKTVLSVVWASYEGRQGIYVLLLEHTPLSGLWNSPMRVRILPCMDILYNAAREELMTLSALEGNGHNTTKAGLSYMILSSRVIPFFAVISRGWNRPVSVYRNGRKEGMMQPLKALMWLSKMASNLAETRGVALDHRELYEKLENLAQPPVNSDIKYPTPEKAPAGSFCKPFF